MKIPSSGYEGIFISQRRYLRQPMKVSAFFRPVFLQKGSFFASSYFDGIMFVGIMFFS